MQLIDLDLIQISPSRQRRSFPLKELTDLAESIKRAGLMHPIVLREEGSAFTLVAGERRLRAVRDIFDLGDSFSFNGSAVPPGFIPYVTLGELDELARREAEWDENNARSDLTWEEKAAATAEMAEIRRLRSAREGLPPPTTASLALAIRGSAEGTHHEQTRRELLVAPHLKDPEIAKAKSVDEAFKILRAREDISRRTALAASIGTSHISLHSALQADLLEWMPNAAPGAFDVILTDPPYGIEASAFGDAAGKLPLQHSYDDSYDTWQNIISCIASEGYRLTKPQAHLYLFCDIDRFAEAKERFSAAGWRVHRTPIIVHKLDATRVPWPEHGPRRHWEMILYAVKGDRKVTRIGPDVIPCRGDENLGHAAQKPIALLVELLSRSISPGDRILDPCAGSGSIFPAASQVHCIATGLEIAPESYALCVQRINSLKEKAA